MLKKFPYEYTSNVQNERVADKRGGGWRWGEDGLGGGDGGQIKESYRHLHNLFPGGRVPLALHMDREGAA